MDIDFIELTTPESLQAVRDIASDIWPKTFRSILSQEQIVYMMNMMYAPEVMEKEQAEGYHFILLKINGSPAGYISWSAYQEKTAKLHKLYLLEQFHGQGFGSAMLREVRKQAAAQGFSILRLNVNKYNQRAYKAYIRNGFQVTESVKIDIGNGFFMDDYVMSCPL